MSTLKVNTIRHTGASSDAVTLASDGTCTAKITNNLSNRNLVVNGSCIVAQRSTDASATVGFGSVDRFSIQASGADNNPDQLQSDVASGTTPYSLGFRKAFKIRNGNQTSGGGTGDRLRFYTALEAQDIANSGWDYKSASSYITLSFWVKSSVAQTFYVHLQAQDTPVYNYAFPYSATTSWTKITKTIPGNSNLVFNNDNGNGLTLFFGLFYGTDNTDSGFVDSTWNAYSTSSQSKDYTSTWYTTDNATYEITGVQLEVGDVATDFEHSSYGHELTRCQR